jgi:3-deoxy-manno-octulosonate cytidylyltransferase (CMP-KDO synthetase)
MNKKIILIPTRLNSKRLKNKALLTIEGLPLIVHTYKRALLSKKANDVYVCTDSIKIKEVCKSHNVKVIMTKINHKNGTERIAEASNKLGLKKKDIIIDVQGDEPLVNPNQIDQSINFFEKNNFDITLPNIKINNGTSQNIVKLITTNDNKVLWMTRAEAPIYFNKKKKFFFKHLSIIVFNKQSLLKYAKFKISKNEKLESIELLRAIENNMSIGTFTVNSNTFSVDVLEDYLKAIRYFKKDKIKKLYLQKNLHEN